MIAGAVNKEFGVLACDSSKYDEKEGELSFQAIKLFNTDKYLITYMGTPYYFANIKREKLGMDFVSLIVYLETYLKNERPRVGKMLKAEIMDREESRPFFCMLILGIHRKLPTLVQFNSFLDFKPKYFFSEKETKFNVIHYGDEYPEKKKAFIDSTLYMQDRFNKSEDKSMGMVAEILARGIYKKVDTEKKQRTGGIINAAGMKASGLMVPLSGTLLA